MTGVRTGLTEGDMVAASPSPSSVPDPYYDNETKTFRIGGPIEISITTVREASHVPPARPPMPPPPSPDRDRAIAQAIIEGLQPFIMQIIEKLGRIEEAQGRAPDDVPHTVD